MKGPQYATENARSKRAKMARPRDLLAWFLAGFREEMPDRLHTKGVWVGKPPRKGEAFASFDPKTGEVMSTERDLTGGSHLGAPRQSDPFRSYIEGDPFGTQPDELEGHKSIRNHYRTPMKAAIATLAGRGRDTDVAPFMARTLFRTALRDGDWDGACSSMGITEPVRPVYIKEALFRLWEVYREEPPTSYFHQGGVAA